MSPQTQCSILKGSTLIIQGLFILGRTPPSLLGLIAVHGLTIDDSVKDHYPDPGGGHGALNVDVPHHDMWCKRDRRPLEH